MDEFIVSLYENENFPLYLGAIIVVLLIAFVIVFFLGKKDKKNIEKTQRLEQIKDDAFKEVSIETPVNVPAATVEVSPEQVVQSPVIPMAETPVSAPIVDNTSVISSQPVIENPVVDTPVEPVNYETPIVANPSVQETPVVENSPVSNIPVQQSAVQVEAESYRSPQTIDKLDVGKPVPKFDPDPVIEPYIPDSNLDSFNNLASSIENELNELEKQQELAKPVLQSITPDAIVDTPAVPATPVIEVPVAPVEPVIIPDVPEMVNVTPSDPSTQNAVPVLAPEEPEAIHIESPTQPVSSNPTKVVDVFSSVYVPQKKEEEESFFDDTMAIELPKLKDTNN